MADFVAVTEEQLARARQDPAFRRKLLAENLDFLLATLNKMSKSRAAAEPACARQIRDGVELAVKLAGLLQTIPENGPPRAA